MLESLRGKVSDRKLRLFACACCRHIWHMLIDDRSRKAIEVAERFADGMATLQELEDAANALNAAFHTANDVLNAADNADASALYDPDTATAFEAARPTADALEAARTLLGSGRNHYFPFRATWHVVNADAHEAAVGAANCLYTSVVGDAGSDIAARKAASKFICQYRRNLFRDIFGNPLCRVAIDPTWLAWNDGTVIKLAQVIYDERTFQCLPVLADALEEAGCMDADILAHCRQPGKHVRACWVVDLLLGKE